MYDVARRGLQEELALDPSEYRLELLAFVLDRGTNQWGCAFVAHLYDTTARELVDRRTRGAPDKWEHDALESVPFTVDDVITHLLHADRRDRWTPVAPALYYLSLVRRYGRASVERVAARTIRRVEPRAVR